MTTTRNPFTAPLPAADDWSWLGPLSRWVDRYLSRHGGADPDARQEALIAAVRARRVFVPSRGVWGRCLQVYVMGGLKNYRTAQRRQRGHWRPGDAETVAQPRAEQHTSAAEQVARLRREAQRLLHAADIVELMSLGYTQAETARLLGLTRARVGQIVKLLRLYMQGEDTCTR